MGATKDKVHRGRQLRRITDVGTAIILSLAGVAMSFCSYQCSLWAGRQAMRYDRADKLRSESLKYASRSQQLAMIDVASFMAWLQAEVTGETRLEEALRSRLRKEFRPAFDAWRSQNPLENASAPPTPFATSAYQSADRERAERLSEEADAFSTLARNANAQSDQYSLNTVIFGMALFFGGVATHFRRPRLQFTVMGMSTLLIVGGVGRLLQLPRERPTAIESRAPGP